MELALSLWSEQGDVHIDSATVLSIGADSTETEFTWRGQLSDPVLALDGLTGTPSKAVLQLRFRLVHDNRRIALGASSFTLAELSIRPRETSSVGPLKDTSVLPLNNRITGMITMTYSADVDAEGLITLRILHVHLNWMGDTLQMLLNRRGHKVTCMIGTSAVYLSRPQRICTTSKNARTYTWTSKPAPGSGGSALSLPLAQLTLDDESLRDLQLISAPAAVTVLPKTPRALNRSQTMYAPNYVADDDMMGNSLQRLPVRILQRDISSVRFFNFCVAPPLGPLSVTVPIAWSDFVSAYESPALLLTKHITNQLQCRISFTLAVVEKYILITGIELCASNFDESLRFFTGTI